MKKFIVTAAVVALGFLGAGAADAYYTYTGGILTVGSTGTAVMNLQTCLAELGNNPSSNVDGVYGPITANAVMQFQMDHNMNNNPDILVDGIVGPQTGPLYTAACAAEYASDNGMDSDDMDEDDSDEEFPTYGGDEASLEDYNLSSEDDAEEGALKHVATIEFDVEDGDVLIERLDLTFEFTGNNPTGDADDEPWDVFESLVLTVDGDEIAEEDLDDEDDWREDSSPFEFRVTGLDFVVEEGDEAEIEVHLMAQDNIDDVDNASWEVSVGDEGVRGIDTAGITQYVGQDTDKVEFNVDSEGGDEEIKIKSSSNDPDSATLEVEEDENSDWYEVFVFELEAEENDIDIDEIEITSETVANFMDVIEDAKLDIDGDDSFDDFEVLYYTDADFDTLEGGDGLTESEFAKLTFDIDEDATVDADEDIDVTLMVEFRRQGDNDGDVSGDADDNYDLPQAVKFGVLRVEGEGQDDVFDVSALTGEEHTLQLAVAEIDNVDSEVSVDDPNDSGRISWTFTVDASEADEDIEFSVTTAGLNGANDDVKFEITGPTPGIASSALTLLDGDATDATVGPNTVWTVAEGDEATFALDTTFTTAAPADSGTYRVRLDEVAGVTIDEISSGLGLSN